MKKNILKVLGVLVLFIALSVTTASATTPPPSIHETQTTINVSPSGFTIRITFDDWYYNDPVYNVHITGYVDIFMKYGIPGNPSTVYQVGQDESHKKVDYLRRY